MLEADGRVALRLADGRLAVFAPPAPGRKSYCRREQLELEQLPDSSYRVWHVRERVWYMFAAHPARPEQVLMAIEDANGFAIGLAYTAAGHLHTLTDSAARRLDCTTDALGRILAISGPDPDQAEARLPLVQYAYEAAGNLVQATDALGHAWQFEYARHLLVQETNRVGLRFYFEYAGLDHIARCRRTWGDGGIYDTKLTQTTRPDGTRTQRVYNAQNLLEQAQDAIASTWQWRYDAAGNLLERQDPLGAVTQYCYENGLLMEVIDAVGHRTRLAYDAQYNLRHIVTPDDSIRTRHYDQLGRLVQATDATGRATSSLRPPMPAYCPARTRWNRAPPPLRWRRQRGAGLR